MNIRADIIFKDENNTVLSFNRFNGLEKYVSNSRSTADNSQPSYGLIARTGSLEIHDKNNSIQNAIRNGLHEDGFDIKLYLDRDDSEDNGLIATVQATNDMSYNIFTKVFNVVFEDKLVNLQKFHIRINKKYEYNLLNLYYDLLSYIPFDFDMDFNQLSANTEEWMSKIVIPIAFLDQDNAWNQLNKISSIAQLKVFTDEDGFVEVVRVV